MAPRKSSGGLRACKILSPAVLGRENQGFVLQGSGAPMGHGGRVGVAHPCLHMGVLRRLPVF